MLSTSRIYNEAYDRPIFQEIHEVEIGIRTETINQHAMEMVKRLRAPEHELGDLTMRYTTGPHRGRLKILDFGATGEIDDDTEQMVFESSGKVTNQYAGFEHNFLRLGSNMQLWSEQNANHFQGYASREVCDAAFNFPAANPPRLRIRFNRLITIPYGKLGLQFDNISRVNNTRGIHPQQMRITFRNRADEAAVPGQNSFTITTSNTTDEMFDFDRESGLLVFDFEKVNRPMTMIDIEFLRMNRPFVRARIFSIFLWGAKVFPPDMLKNFTCNWDIDPTMSRLPQQKTAFTYHDHRDRFNPENPRGDFGKYVDGKPIKAQLITTYHNKPGEVCQTPICDMQLSGETTWNNKTATFTANSHLQMLNQNFTPKFLPIGTTIQELFDEVEEVIDSCLPELHIEGQQNSRVRVSTEARDELTRLSAPGPNNPNRIMYRLPEKPLNQYLQMIAQALCCVVFEDAFGVIHLCKRDECIGANAPGRPTTAPANATITFNDIFGNPTYSRTVEPSQVTVKYYDDEKPPAAYPANAEIGEIQPINNILICNETWAKKVAEHIFYELSLRNQYLASIRDGIAIEPCDAVRAEVRFGEENKTPPYLREAFVFKKNLTFNGALKSDLEYLLKEPKENRNRC